MRSRENSWNGQVCDREGGGPTEDEAFSLYRVIYVRLCPEERKSFTNVESREISLG